MLLLLLLFIFKTTLLAIKKKQMQLVRFKESDNREELNLPANMNLTLTYEEQSLN